MTTTPRLRTAPSRVRGIPLFSTGEAEGSGISRKDLAILVRRGALWQPARGWYSALSPERDDDRHILRTIATLRLYGGAAAASGHSAALLHGLPLARCDLTRVEIASPSGHGRTRAGVRVTPLDTKGAPPVVVPTPLAQTETRVVDVATAIVGTALGNNLRAALVAADHAVRHGLCTVQDLMGELDRRQGCRGIASARETLAHVDPRHESPGETLTAAALRGGSWAFDPQVWVRARSRNYRLDFGLREHKVAIEFDGDIKYTGPEVMEAQLSRDADLITEGWTMLHVVWAEVDDETALNYRVSQAVAQAQRRD